MLQPPRQLLPMHGLLRRPCPGDKGWRAPKGKRGVGLRAPGFLFRLGPITNYQEELISRAGKLREEAVPFGELPVPAIEQNVNEHVQAVDRVQVPEEQGAARATTPRSPSRRISEVA